MKKKTSFITIILTMILLGLTLVPFYLLLANSFKLHRDIVINPWNVLFSSALANYVTAFNIVAKPIINTLFVMVCVVLGTIFLSVLASFAFARFEFVGKEGLYYFIIAMLMIPGFVMIVPQFVQIVGFGMYDTYAGLILPPIAYNVALSTFLMRKSMEGISKSMFEAADIEGANNIQILCSIVVPLSGPIISTVTIMTGLSTWNNYIWPLVVSSGSRIEQIAVALTKMSVPIDQGNGALFAGYVIAALPLLIIFCLASKQFVQGLTQGAVKG